MRHPNSGLPEFGQRRRHEGEVQAFLGEIEQLHAVTIARSVVHSKRTWPQWQPPAPLRPAIGVRSSNTGANGEQQAANLVPHHEPAAALAIDCGLWLAKTL